MGCQQCGEPYFEEWEVDAIQTLIRSAAERARKSLRNTLARRNMRERQRQA
jgi:hypothetical protein